MAKNALVGSATYLEMIDGLSFSNSCIHCAEKYGVKTPDEVLKLLLTFAPSADCTERIVRSLTASPSPSMGSSSENALFLTQMAPRRRNGVMFVASYTKFLPTPIAADHWSPLGLDVAAVMIAG